MHARTSACIHVRISGCEAWLLARYLALTRQQARDAPGHNATHVPDNRNAKLLQVAEQKSNVVHRRSSRHVVRRVDPGEHERIEEEGGEGHLRVGKRRGKMSTQRKIDASTQRKEMNAPRGGSPRRHRDRRRRSGGRTRAACRCGGATTRRRTGSGTPPGRGVGSTHRSARPSPRPSASCSPPGSARAS